MMETSEGWSCPTKRARSEVGRKPIFLLQTAAKAMLKQARYSGAHSADAVKASVSWVRQPDADADGARAASPVDAARDHEIHVQNVNAYHARLRQWLTPFRGVASRYLPNYLGWRWALDMGRIATVEQLFSIAIKLIYTKR